MNRIAIISDIHGNMPALDAVVEDLREQQVDEVLVGGDLVGRGPQGSRVVQRIRELGWPTIGGNHEDYLLSFRRREVPKPWLEAEEWAASRWMARELGSEAAGWVRELPFSLRRPGMELVHGTPRSNREGIGPWVGESQIEAFAGQTAEQVLVCAHTHRPMVRNTPRGLVLNVGSVGMPFNRDQRAQYALLERDSDGEQRVELRQVPYDLDEIFRIYERTGFLAAGGITARLLRLELEHAAPLLVPFLEWCKATGRTPSLNHLDAFFSVHRPGDSLGPLFQRLQALKKDRGGSGTEGDSR